MVKRIVVDKRCFVVGLFFIFIYYGFIFYEYNRLWVSDIVIFELYSMMGCFMVIDVSVVESVLIRIDIMMRLINVYMILKIWVGIDLGDWLLYLLINK